MKEKHLLIQPASQMFAQRAGKASSHCLLSLQRSQPIIPRPTISAKSNQTPTLFHIGLHPEVENMNAVIMSDG